MTESENQGVKNDYKPKLYDLNRTFEVGKFSLKTDLKNYERT